MSDYSILGTSKDGSELVWLAGPFSSHHDALALYPVLLRAFDRCGLKGFCMMRTDYYDSADGPHHTYLEKVGLIPGDVCDEEVLRCLRRQGPTASGRSTGSSAT